MIWRNAVVDWSVHVVRDANVQIRSLRYRDDRKAAASSAFEVIFCRYREADCLLRQPAEA
jgi:hypothetical protein